MPGQNFLDIPDTLMCQDKRMFVIVVWSYATNINKNSNKSSNSNRRNSNNSNFSNNSFRARLWRWTKCHHLFSFLTRERVMNEKRGNKAAGCSSFGTSHGTGQVLIPCFTQPEIITSGNTRSPPLLPLEF